MQLLTKTLLLLAACAATAAAASSAQRGVAHHRNQYRAHVTQANTTAAAVQANVGHDAAHATHGDCGGAREGSEDGEGEEEKEVPSPPAVIADPPAPIVPELRLFPSASAAPPPISTGGVRVTPYVTVNGAGGMRVGLRGLGAAVVGVVGFWL